MKKTLLAAVVFLTLCVSAKADTAGELRAQCLATDIDPSVITQEQMNSVMNCYGYIEGFAETINSYYIALPGATDPGIYDYSLAPGVTNAQAANAFLTFMIAHPERANDPAPLVLRDALGSVGLLIETKVPASQPAAKSSKRSVALLTVPEVTPIATLVAPYTPSPDGTMLVHITVNGMPTDALFDSGSSSVSVNFSDFGIEKTSEGTFALANGEVQQTGTGTAVICMGQRSTNGRGLSYDVCLQANATDTPTAAIPLIGQSFIGLFRTMSINRVNHTITLVP